jgi:type II secretory pathway pseudopilin PulG
MTVKQKYTILKVLIQNSTKGFTILELVFGLLILLLIGGFTMNALIESGNSFNKDRKDIQSAQNLTAVLELIGNDVKQAGERIISDDRFPTIEIRQETSTTLADGSPIQRSTLIVRRGVVPSPLTLCEDISAGTAATRTTLIVRDTTLNVPVGTNPGCDYNPAPPTAPAPPSPLREAVNYRCELGDPNFSFNPALDSCSAIPSAPALQRGLIALSRQDGNICVYNYTGESLAATPTRSTLTVAATSTCAITDPITSLPIVYNTNLPIYLIEERRYTLDTSGNLQVSVNGGTPSTLISGIAKFKVSARGYKVTALGVTPAFTLDDRVIEETGIFDPISGGGSGISACTAADEVAMPTATPSAADPTYACRLNFGANVANWKQIAGVRIEMQAKYDPTGRETYADAVAIPNNKNIEKLKASAEYFPRNVLSK